MPLVLPTKPKEVKRLTPEQEKKKRERDHKVVKGIFRCFEPQGGSMTFHFKKYKGDDVLTYTLVDGKRYELPLMVAHHLNRNCNYPRNQWLMDADGQYITDSGSPIQRCSFESLEFNDLVLEE